YVAVANLDAGKQTNDILTGPGAGDPLLHIFMGPIYTTPSMSFFAFRNGTGTVLATGSAVTFNANSPGFGVSSVAFGAFTDAKSTMRDIIVGTGIGRKAVQVTMQPTKFAKTASHKRSMFFSRRAPRGVHVAGRR